MSPAPVGVVHPTAELTSKAGRRDHRSTQAPAVIIHPTAGLTSKGVASRLVTHLVERQSLAIPALADAEGTGGRIGRTPGAPLHLSVTGGGLGTSLWPDLVAHPAAAAVDWRCVHIWFSDERFVAADDAARNDRPVLEAADALGLSRGHVHSVPGPDSVPDVRAAAVAYANELAWWAGPARPLGVSSAARPTGAAERSAPSGRSQRTGPRAPLFAVSVLGIGADGHVASLFPGRIATTTTALTLAVTDSPKEPPQRVSFGRGLLNHCDELWLIAAGPDKADAVGRALRDDAPLRTPAARLRGRRRTLWLVDAALAAALS